VGLWGRLGAGTRLASGGEEREGWERILARSFMHGSGLLLSSFSPDFLIIARGWGGARCSAS
jgi:hypothetical protein